MLYNSIERKFKSRQNPSMTTEVRSGHFGEGGWIGQKREGACWVLEMFCLQLHGGGYMYVKIHQIMHLRFVHFTCNLFTFVYV